MYTVKVSGYGPIKGKPWGKFKSFNKYEKWIMKKVFKARKYLKENKLLTKKELALLDNYIKKKAKLSSVSFVLTHQDISGQHIIIKNNQIEGIIDLADIKSDDPMADFRRIALSYDQEYFKYVLKGYGRTNAKRIELYKFFLAIQKIPQFHNKRDPKYFNYFVSFLKKVIKKRNQPKTNFKHSQTNTI